MITPNQWFYDGQIRRFLVQFIRAVSGFQVEFGKDPNGNSVLKMVPVIYGDGSRQVAQIIRGNSENTMPCVPAIAVYISGLEYDRTRVQEPYHIGKVHMRERKYNDLTDEWEGQQGDAYTVERLMPVPYKLSMKLDMWTSNTDQKLQLWEQMAVLFNPALEIQSTDNYIDWTSLSAIFMDTTSWTSRSVPVGAEDQIDVATWSFTLPIWISPPARVKKLGIIQKIISNIYDDTGALSEDMDITAIGRSVVTPMGYKVLYLGNTLKLVKATETLDSNGQIVIHLPNDPWNRLIDTFGTLKPGVTEIRLLLPDNVTQIVGTVNYHPTDDNLLLFTPFVDTLPANNTPPVNAIVDPQSVLYDTVKNAVTGTRFLLTNNVGSDENVAGAEVWESNGHDLVADANDIVEFNGTNWIVSLSAAAATEAKYVTNITTGTQYKWTPEDQEWTKSFEGMFMPSNWSLIL
jgi:hypothetical protein